MDKNLIAKIISGQASDKEKEDYYNLISEDKKEEELFFETKNLWVKSGATNALPETIINAEFESFWKKITSGNKSRQRNLRIQILRYAAVALILIGIGSVASYFVFRQSFQPGVGPQKFIAERGSLAHVELADGTTVWLNSGSEITYNQNKYGDRQVNLKGEAYFDVHHSKEHSFIVNVGDIKIKDIGTIFNVKAYPGDKEIETTLIEGKIDILRKDNQQIVSLKPGEYAEYIKAGKKMKISTADVSLIAAWKDAKFSFRDKPLGEICHDLENWYDVKFQFKNEKVKDYRYTGVIKRTTTISYVLKMLTVTTNIQYKINEKIYEPDEIIIF